MRGGAGGTPGRGSTLIRSFLLSAVFLCVPAALREILFFMWRKKVPRAKPPKRKEDMKSDPSDRAEDGPQCGPYRSISPRSAFFAAWREAILLSSKMTRAEPLRRGERQGRLQSSESGGRDESLA